MSFYKNDNYGRMRIFVVLLLAAWTSVTANTITHRFEENNEKSGFRLVSQNNEKVVLDYSIDQFSISEISIDGELFHNISLPGHFLPNTAGAPNLPGSSRYIALPMGATARLKVNAISSEEFDHINVVPSHNITKSTDSSPLVYKKDVNIYSKDDFYPSAPAEIFETTVIRGLDVALLRVTPFQFNPVSGRLIVYTEMEIEISFEGATGDFGDERLRSRWWDPMISDMVLNHKSLPEVNYNKTYLNTDDAGGEYLIITPTDSEFQSWADTIKQFRNTQGISTVVVALDEIGGNTATLIENYINDAYNNWDVPPVACLLLGDYGTNPANSVAAPVWNGYCVSDNIYGDIFENELPDIVMARICARNEGELRVMIEKFINNEKTPPDDPDFYQNPITSLGWQTGVWYQLCSEVVGGFWSNELNKTPVRINEIASGTPGSIWSTAVNTDMVVNYFGENGLGYIPDDPSVLGGWTGGNADALTTAINNGAFMVQHRDHGSNNGWAEPYYQLTHLNNLTNTDLTFVWSIDCLTGKFNYADEVFAEKFYRLTHKDEYVGCFGINAASEVTYNLVPDVYAWGAYDYMWPDFMPGYGATPDPRGVLPAFASAAGKYHLQFTGWVPNTTSKIATYHLFHHHGDAFSSVYTQMPQNLTVVHESFLYMNETTFEVTADTDALIALTVNEEIIGSATGTGAPVSISIPAQTPPDKVLVTVTKQDHYRYSALVDVLPASGPYVVYNDVTINDAAGNGNGIMETDEVITASVAIENIGVEDANNLEVKVVTVDPYIVMTDSLETFGFLSAGSTGLMEDAFAWEVADNIPDLHSVLFNMTIMDGALTWTSTFSITAHGSEIEFGNLVLDEYLGNSNGHLDPGETVYVVIPTFNTGSYNAADAMGYLSCSSSFISISDTSFNFYGISAGSMEEAFFIVTVADDAPIGAYYEFIYEVTTWGYFYQQSYPGIISPVVEDWETGDLTSFAWVTGGDDVWDISTTDPYQGSYCIKSGGIDHNQATFLSLDFEVYVPDSLSFWIKVSSEEDYDLLRFFINDVEQDSWSGEVNWQRISYLIPEGIHNLKWEYSKDATTTNGSDGAWLDLITFPTIGMLCAFNSDETDICEGESVSFTDQSSGDITNWVWTFEGGNPATSTLQNPVVEYASEGIYDVTLIVSNASLSDTLSLADYITVTVEPGVPPSPEGPEMVCSDTPSTSYSTTGLAGIDDYDWLLQPVEAGTVTGFGQYANVDWDMNFLGTASLSVAGENICGIGTYSAALNVTRYFLEVTLDTTWWICHGWPAFELTGGIPEGGTYSGVGVVNGYFNPALAGNGEHEIIYTFTDANNCENADTASVVVDPCTGINETIAETSIHIYPNPASEKITVESKVKLQTIQIINAFGQKVFEKSTESQKIEINTRKFNAGIYQVKVFTEGHVITKKLLIE